MKFFSGFYLQKEKELFNFWLDDSAYTVAGFSYGSIKAVEYVLNTDKRVDRLILLSPAFFNNKDEKFKRTQLIYFQKDPNKYVKNFLKNCSYNSNINLEKYLKPQTIKELKELLYYKWNLEKLKEIINKGITIEVILGENDKIIDAKSALNFFNTIVTTYFIKKANHILRTNND